MNSKLIEINLSEKFKQRKKKSEPLLKFPNVVGILVVVIIFIFAITHLLLYVRKSNFKKMNTEYSRLKKPAKETSELIKMSKILEEKYKILNSCAENWIHLGGKWLELAKLTPDAIYLQEIKISNENKPNGKKNILIYGRASGKEGESIILKYLEALKTSKIFNKDFQVQKIKLSPIYTEGNEKIFSINLTQ